MTGTFIYHLVEEVLWKAAVTSGQGYFSPTYDADGFIHAMHPEGTHLLLSVANHFYTGEHDTTDLPNRQYYVEVPGMCKMICLCSKHSIQRSIFTTTW